MRKTILCMLMAWFVFDASGQDFSWLEDHLTGKIRVEGEVPVEQSISRRLKQYNIPGVSIAIVKSGNIVYAKGFGIADKRRKMPMTERTLLQAASISKPLAATAALKLVAQGKVGLDTDVNVYLKSWKVPEGKFTATEKVTLRRLLSHTAGVNVHGFPGYNQKDSLPSTSGILEGKGNTPVIVVDIVPGSIWRYSGGGYTIVQQLIEDVTGMKMDEFMERSVLPEMSMAASSYSQPLSTKFESLASAAYDASGKMYEGGWRNYPELAAAGLWTTPSDLARYCMQVQRIYTGDNKESIFSKAMLEQMLTPHLNDYGLGLGLRWEGDSLLFGHNGSNAGFSCSMLAFAGSGDGIVVMTNSDNGQILIEEIMRAVSDHYRWNIRKQEVVKPVQADREALKKFTGKYAYEMYGKTIYIRSKLKKGKVVLYDPDTPGPVKLIPLSPLEFIDPEKNIRIDFVLNDKEEVAHLLWDKQWIVVKTE